MLAPKWILAWLLISAVICCFDALFVLNRPESLNGGSLFWIFWPYENYYRFDTLYAMNTDTFVVIQSWLNIIESSLAVVAVILSISKCNIKKVTGAVLIIVIESFIFWKTVIFVWYDHDFLTDQAKSFVPMSILCYYLPSSVWLILPVVSLVMMGKSLVKAICKNEIENKKVKKQ